MLWEDLVAARDELNLYLRTLYESADAKTQQEMSPHLVGMEWQTEGRA